MLFNRSDLGDIVLYSLTLAVPLFFIYFSCNNSKKWEKEFLDNKDKIMKSTKEPGKIIIPQENHEEHYVIIICPTCAQKLRIPENVINKKIIVRCKNCGQQFTAPFIRDNI